MNGDLPTHSHRHIYATLELGHFRSSVISLYFGHKFCYSLFMCLFVYFLCKNILYIYLYVSYLLSTDGFSLFILIIFSRK